MHLRGVDRSPLPSIILYIYPRKFVIIIVILLLLYNLYIHY
jgi:hypothetical protein